MKSPRCNTFSRRANYFVFYHVHAHHVIIITGTVISTIGNILVYTLRYNKPLLIVY